MLRIHKGYEFNSLFNYGDKSITHRALILASIAKGKTEICNANVCADTVATIRCLRKLGAKIEVKKGEKIVVTPIKKAVNNQTLDCANSGTTARLVAGLVCGLNLSARFVGDQSLSRRPFDRIIQPLRQMGASIEKGENCLFEICQTDNKLTAIDYTLPHASAQVKSAILICGLFADGKTVVREKHPSRNHTENMMRYMNCQIEVCSNAITVQKSVPKGCKISVPNDISTAMYFVALGILDKGILLKNVGVNPTRMGAFEALQRAGANIQLVNVREKNFEQIADIVVVKSCLKPLNVPNCDVARTVDEFVILALLATATRGKSHFCGLCDLRNKESDRLAAMVELVEFLGQRAAIEGDDLIIESDGNVTLADGIANTHFDHRLAMTYVVAAVLWGSITLSDAKCIEVSAIKFLDQLETNTKSFALLGADIANSSSPKLFKHFADISKQNISYTLCPMSQNCTDDDILYVLDSFDGVNVTMPFKMRVAKLLNSKVDSVNTVFCSRNNQKSAVSTDGYGIVESLKKAGIANLLHQKILVVGAGGTAETAVVALLGQGADVNVVNRTQDKALALQRKWDIDYTLDSFDGIVSCIPCCEFENTIDISTAKFVLSVAYKQQSNLVRRAIEQNILAIDGLSVLYFQGKRSFEIWTGQSLPDTFEQFKKERAKQ